MFLNKPLHLALVLPFVFACATTVVEEAAPPPAELAMALSLAAPGADPTEITCTGGTGPGQTRTCTSDLIFPCVEGWTPCKAEGAKTCCKKTFDVTDTAISDLTSTG